MQNIFKTLILSLFSLLIITTGVYALGTLTPQGTAGDDTQYSLNDIYERISDYSYSPESTSSPFTTPGSVSASFYTLTDIWDLLDNQPDLLPENIAQGATILGVEGELTVGSPELEWSNEAPASLCWDANQGCSEGSGLLNGEGAVEYCANLDENGTGWRLPTIEEYQSITDFTMYDNATQVSGFAQGTPYWSSTPYVEFSNFVWTWNSYNGYINVDNVSVNYSVRCVR